MILVFLDNEFLRIDNFREKNIKFFSLKMKKTEGNVSKNHSRDAPKGGRLKRLGLPAGF